MRDIKARKADLEKMLDELVDPVLLTRGFARRKNSTTYKRKLPETVQELDFSPQYSPRYRPGAEAHIYPRLIIKMQKLYDIVLRLGGGDPLFGTKTPSLILNIPIESAAPKGKRPQWYSYSADDYAIVGKEICKFIEMWVYDLLETLRDPDGLIGAHETADDRFLIVKDNMWYVKVAAAYMLRGDRDSALGVLEGRFKNLDAPKRYAVVFELFPSIATS